MTKASKPARVAKQQGVDKVEIGLRLAFMLADAGKPLHLRELAKASGMPPSKVHRYLVSLCRSGLLYQDPVDGRYDLGPSAVHLGLAAQNRIDEFRLGELELRKLHEKTGMPSAMISWASHGATIVRRIDPMQPIIVSVRVGSTVSVVNSAAGRIFAAFLPAQTVEPFIEAEFAAGIKPTVKGRVITQSAFRELLQKIRKERFAFVQGDFLQGFDAISAPTFDQNGNIVMALGVLGPAGSIGVSPDSPHRRAVMEANASLSRRFGFSH